MISLTSTNPCPVLISFVSILVANISVTIKRLIYSTSIKLIHHSGFAFTSFMSNFIARRTLTREGTRKWIHPTFVFSFPMTKFIKEKKVPLKDGYLWAFGCLIGGCLAKFFEFIFFLPLSWLLWLFTIFYTALEISLVSFPRPPLSLEGLFPVINSSSLSEIDLELSSQSFSFSRSNFKFTTSCSSLAFIKLALHHFFQTLFNYFIFLHLYLQVGNLIFFLQLLSHFPMSFFELLQFLFQLLTHSFASSIFSFNFLFLFLSLSRSSSLVQSSSLSFICSIFRIFLKLLGFSKGTKI